MVSPHVRYMMMWKVGITLPYMGLGEFYCDYGDFDYYITAPAKYGSSWFRRSAKCCGSTYTITVKSDLLMPKTATKR